MSAEQKEDNLVSEQSSVNESVESVQYTEQTTQNVSDDVVGVTSPVEMDEDVLQQIQQQEQQQHTVEQQQSSDEQQQQQQHQSLEQSTNEQPIAESLTEEQQLPVEHATEEQQLPSESVTTEQQLSVETATDEEKSSAEQVAETQSVEPSNEQQSDSTATSSDDAGTLQLGDLVQNVKPDMRNATTHDEEPVEQLINDPFTHEEQTQRQEKKEEAITVEKKIEQPVNEHKVEKSKPLTIDSEKKTEVQNIETNLNFNSIGKQTSEHVPIKEKSQILHKDVEIVDIYKPKSKPTYELTELTYNAQNEEMEEFSFRRSEKEIEEDLNSSNAELEELIEETYRKINYLVKEIEFEEQNTHKYKNQLYKATSDARYFETEIQKLQLQLEDIRKHRQYQKDLFNERAQRLSSELQQIESDFKVAKQQYQEELAKKRVLLKAEKNAAKELVKLDEILNTELEVKSAELREKTKFEFELSNIKLKIEQAENELQDQEHAKSQLELEIENMKQFFEAEQKERAQLEMQLNELQQERDQLKQLVQKHQEEKDTLERENQKIMLEVERMRTRVDQETSDKDLIETKTQRYKNQFTDLKYQLEKEKNLVQMTEREKKSLETQVELARKRCEDLSVELNRLKKSERKLQREVARLELQLDQEEKSRSALEKEIRLLQDNERAWQHKYDALQMQIENGKRERNDLNRKIREASFKLSFRSVY
jgi:hypothetical protein